MTRINSRLEDVEEWASDLEDKVVEVSPLKQQNK